MEKEKNFFHTLMAMPKWAENDFAGQDDLVSQIIFALSGAVEAKDRYTNGHSQRVAYYAAEMARRLGYSQEEQRSFFYAGMLHDVGKIRVSDDIINKTDRLTENEYAEMKLHTMAGYYILKEVSAISSFAVGARWHHERYDGRGYPNGLSGENIPLIARAIAVADAYDAMTSSRSYREVLAQEDVRMEIEHGIGTQFDPVFAKVMLQMMDEDKNYDMRQHGQREIHTILAVDDDPWILQMLQLAMKNNSAFRVVTARSGKEAMEMMAREPVELVLLDVEMPEMDGFAVLKWIRQTYGDLPVTFMTGDKGMDIIEKAEKLGISDYLTKPLIIHILWESIYNVLSASKYRNNLRYFERGKLHE